MKVNSILVDEVLVADDRQAAAVRSTLYEFSGPRWVSVHNERGAKKLGPIHLLQEHRADLDQIEDFAVTEFPERALDLHDKSISYRETWTILAGTVYTLVPPEGYHATRIELVGGGESVALEVAAISARRLFYYATFRDPVTRDYCIKARFEYKPAECEKMIKGSEVVEATERFGWLRSAVTTQALSSEFWFKLIDLAGRLMKR